MDMDKWSGEKLRSLLSTLDPALFSTLSVLDCVSRVSLNDRDTLVGLWSTEAFWDGSDWTREAWADTGVVREQDRIAEKRKTRRRFGIRLM